MSSLVQETATGRQPFQHTNIARGHPQAYQARTTTAADQGGVTAHSSTDSLWFRFLRCRITDKSGCLIFLGGELTDGMLPGLCRASPNCGQV